MADHDQVGCASNSAPLFPQANTDICCDPKHTSFGCDYTGVPGGLFNETHGSIADVVPFTHVGGWPGDPNWGAVGAVVPWAVLTGAGDVEFVR
jgi:hypothetical protein